jgi:hypothetical protein
VSALYRSSSERSPILSKFEGYNGRVRSALVSIFLLVLTFDGLLQSSCAAAHPARSPESQATAGQGTEHEAEGTLAIIVQSSSTNTRGYRVLIYKDGSATAEVGGDGAASGSEAPQTQDFPSGTIDVKTLRRLLKEIGDVSKIPPGRCMKSVSFGTHTQIVYAGNTSTDLQCIGGGSTGSGWAPVQASQDLSAFVRTTLGQLKIDARRVGSNP